MADFSQSSTISITCPKGMVPFLKTELVLLGFVIRKTRLAGVEIDGTLDDCMFLNLTLRCAHRIHYQLKSFKARNAEELAEELKSVPWEDYIDKHGYVSLTSFINNRTITNTQFANLAAKDAIVDRIRARKGARPDSGPKLNRTVVFLFWKDDEAAVYLDTSGESLNRRGYRREYHAAPMQETLAAAIIQASKWETDWHFINPMCGSGTIAIEAALIATQKAPGLLRPNFGIKHILGFDEDAWKKLRSELKQASIKEPKGRIIATDHDLKAIEAARKNAQTAGVDHLIEFDLCDFKDTTIPEGNGVVVLNPPYGERLDEGVNLAPLYKSMGDFFKQECSGKWGYVFTGNLPLSKKVGLRSSQRIELYNSTIECRLLEYELY
ncbi:MAG: class I SAM-dependent RNA methyltransferase [Balneolaceae bacterium]|nr:class I SAM-dependent RNA methyltransferase [Balneolaceae bacterium]